MEKMINYYDILGLDFEEAKKLEEGAFKETVLAHATEAYEKITNEYEEGIITKEELETRKQEVREATIVLLDETSRVEYDSELIKALEAEKDEEEVPHRVVVEEEDTKGASKKGRTILKAIGVVALAGLLIWGVKSCSDKTMANRNANVTPSTTVEQTVQTTDSYNGEEATVITETETPAPTEESQQETQEQTTEETTEETQEQTTEETQEQTQEETVQAVNYGDVMDDSLVASRAQKLVSELKAAGIVNPVTTLPYTQEEIVALIKYSNGVYIPSSQEEIDVLHLNLLNLLISPINTDDYLFHVVYATGNDDFAVMAQESSERNATTYARFDESFAQYGENGVYPLVQWITEKRIAIYSTTDREEIAKIYDEVGQVMADLMKGNGCTIKVMENGKEVEYHFTSEQLLANHSSAIIVTTEAQLVFANHYEIRNELGEIVESGKTSWDVYNKLNSNGVDENGKPIYEADHVSLEEIQAWINNGCDYEWAIDDVLIDGQTFGQRIQGDMEGMALNNLAMSQGKTLTK